MVEKYLAIPGKSTAQLASPPGGALIGCGSCLGAKHRCFLIQRLLLLIGPFVLEGFVDDAGDAVTVANGKPKPLRLDVDRWRLDDRERFRGANGLPPCNGQVKQF